MTALNPDHYSIDAVVNEDTVIFPDITPFQHALADIKDGFAQWRIWLMLAYQDIKLRYRRSVLGPFWLTLSMAITVYTMGFLYGKIFHQDLESYYPFLVAGMLSWSLISTIVMELTEGFLGADVYIKQIKLPYSVYIHRLVSRNMIIFFHNIFVIVPILIIYHTHAKVNLNTLLIIPGLLFIYLNGISFGVILAMIGARYRDVLQIVKSLVQVIFFVTPVMWGPQFLHGRAQFIIDWNPFYAFIELIRAPLLGTVPTLNNMIMVACVTTLGVTLSLWMFIRYRARIVYWL
ncbi:MAG: ABC transporter permease [Gammaproteobacteria bacterium]|nr:ABC transporter permease [Gammaproteobacteria bacterium]